jgi:hypothetical protein
MAKVQEEVVFVKFSKLVKDSETKKQPIINDDITSALEQVAQELAGVGVVVDIETQPIN